MPGPPPVRMKTLSNSLNESMARESSNCEDSRQQGRSVTSTSSPAAGAVDLSCFDRGSGTAARANQQHKGDKRPQCQKSTMAKVNRIVSGLPGCPWLPPNPAPQTRSSNPELALEHQAVKTHHNAGGVIPGGSTRATRPCGPLGGGRGTRRRPIPSQPEEPRMERKQKLTCPNSGGTSDRLLLLDGSCPSRGSGHPSQLSLETQVCERQPTHVKEGPRRRSPEGRRRATA